jgi:hypothetical protein
VLQAEKEVAKAVGLMEALDAEIGRKKEVSRKARPGHSARRRAGWWLAGIAPGRRRPLHTQPALRSGPTCGFPLLAPK